jgi:hypothetical protein
MKVLRWKELTQYRVRWLLLMLAALKYWDLMLTRCYWINPLKPNGHYIYTTCFNISDLWILPTECTYVFLMVLSDCFPKQRRRNIFHVMYELNSYISYLEEIQSLKGQLIDCCLIWRENACKTFVGQPHRKWPLEWSSDNCDVWTVSITIEDCP